MDDARSDDLATKLKLVEAAERLAGKEAALRVWRELGLPDIAATPLPPVRDEPDPYGCRLFIAQETEPATHAETPATTLYAAYQRWCVPRGMPPATQTRFGRAVAAAGYTRTTSRIATYRGIRLRA